LSLLKTLKLKDLIKFDFNRFIQMKKLLFLFKYLPLKLWCNDVLKFYIKQNQIDKLYNHIIEAEFLKVYNKIDLKSLRTRRKFIRDIDDIEFDSQKEIIDKFKQQYIQK